MNSWKEYQIAVSGTHHVRGSDPAYEERFDQVLSFHEPGLAAVRKGEHAWHISPSGRPAYARRFERTFGYYQQRAAVCDETGWFHIDVNGAALYNHRFAWCGNFQQSLCAVRDLTDNYFHIKLDGELAYEQKWKYAGDYRDANAVVQGVAGFSTHIDSFGNETHGVWFIDLDVFHKGFARARDAEGWTHIDKTGKAIYRRRFALIEPFYNGQARVERFDGGIEIIDEMGNCRAEVRQSLKSKSSVKRINKLKLKVANSTPLEKRQG